MATRYKLTKDQLERIVENFVMESANIEGKKAPVKNHIPSQSADDKKHVKKKISGDMVEPSEGVPVKPPVMKKKLSQATDAKKHVSNAKVKHTTKAKVVKESDELEEGWGDKIGEFLGTKMNQEKAEKLYNEKYAKNIKWFATTFGEDEGVMKSAIIKFLMKSGGMLIPSGNGKNAQWDSEKKEFVKLGTKLGGPGGVVGG